MVKVDQIGASKPICLQCELDIRKADITPVGKLKDDFSAGAKKRLSPEKQQQIKDEVHKLRDQK